MQIVARKGAPTTLRAEAKQTVALAWQGSDYTLIPAGNYSAVAVGYQGPTWCRQFRRWSIRIEFCLLSGEGSVSRFFNMGDNPDRPMIGRNSLYFQAWTMANGEMPKRGEKMSPERFCEGQVYLIEVATATRNSEQEEKGEGEHYSRVVKILSVDSAAQSFNHLIIQSINQESVNHPIKQSTNQGGFLAPAASKPPRTASPKPGGGTANPSKPEGRCFGSAQASKEEGASEAHSEWVNRMKVDGQRLVRPAGASS